MSKKENIYHTNSTQRDINPTEILANHLTEIIKNSENMNFKTSCYKLLFVNYTSEIQNTILNHLNSTENINETQGKN